MRRHIVWLACVLALCPFWATRGHTSTQDTLEREVGVPGSSLQPGLGRGDFEFHLDVVSGRPAASGRTLVQVLVQVPVQALLEATDANEAHLRLRAGLFDATQAYQAFLTRENVNETGSGEEEPTRRELFEGLDAQIDGLLGSFSGVESVTQAESETWVRTPERALRDTDYQMLEVHLEAPPGEYVLEVLLENLSRTKRGVLDRIRKIPMSSIGRMLVLVPDLERAPALSDLRFESGYGAHHAYASRLYGLLNDSLHVVTTLFAKGEYGVRVEATDRNGEVHWSDSLRLAADGSLPIDLHTSVNTMPAGQYLLHVSASGPQGRVATSRGFDVAWSLVTWKRSRRDFDVEAKLVLGEERFDVFHSLPVGEKERYLEDFWKEFDPTPDTAYNETLEEFNRRVAFADMRFSGTQRGALTDRGKVYIYFGAPDERYAEAVPSFLAGTGGKMAIEKVEDGYVPLEHGTQAEDYVESWGGGSIPQGESRRQQEYRRVVGGASEVVSYEVWIYGGGGDPLLQADYLAIDTGLRILFADLEGSGRYRLLKSSVPLGIPGLRVHF